MRDYTAAKAAYTAYLDAAGIRGREFERLSLVLQDAWWAAAVAVAKAVIR